MMIFKDTNFNWRDPRVPLLFVKRTGCVPLPFPASTKMKFDSKYGLICMVCKSFCTFQLLINVKHVGVKFLSGKN